MKKVLITGCAGFIGCHVSAYFLEKGYQVIGLDNLSRLGSKANLTWLRAKAHRGFHFYKVDIRDYPKVAGIYKQHKGFDLVIHEAGQVAVTTSVTNPREDFEINALGTFNMLEATRLLAPEAFFEFSSTNKVYGKMEDVEVIEKNGRYEYKKFKQGIDERFPLDFHSPYGCSKGAADQYVRDYSRIYGLRTVVLRQSCIYGTHQFGIEDQGWVAWFTIASLLGKKVTIYGDGKQVRDVLWIDDLVDAFGRLYHNRGKVSGQIFNVGGGPTNVLSLNELVHRLMHVGVMKQRPGFADWRAGDQKVFVADVSNIKNAIGWQPKVSPEQGLTKLIDWSCRNKALLNKMLSGIIAPALLSNPLLELMKAH